jgi:4-amino-4-deoxy-L-arabinose transferase-like glycosyltransferase
MIDPTQTQAAVYPPGYPLWLALLYGISGSRSIYLVQVVQLILGSFSILLIVGIGSVAFNRRTGIWAGILAALSPLLAFYGSSPLADSPASWFVLAGIWMFITAAKRERVGWALGAGALIGASCWFRANALLLVFVLAPALIVFANAVWQRRVVLSAALIGGAVLIIAPIMVRNAIVFEAFIPVGLGAGTNLWEGIGETSRAGEFGAVYGDDALLERERAELGLPTDEQVTLYYPNGIERDRERARKALEVIAANPLWYAGVMAGRMWGLLKYAGQDSGIYGSTGVNVTPQRSLPPSLSCLPIKAVVTGLGWLQSVLRYLILPLMIIGIWLTLRENRRMTLLILSPVFYYLVVGTALHTEVRYSLPMQATLYVFAGVAAAWLVSFARATNVKPSGQ